jgi:predicted MFS family arabinose efflux permease
MAVGLTVLAIGPSPALAIGATAILGFGFSFPWSSIASTVLRKIPSGERGSAVGALSAFVDLFVGISSFTAGAVAHRFGYSAAFGLAALSLIAAAVAGRFVFVTGQTQEAVVAASVEEEASPVAALLPDL